MVEFEYGDLQHAEDELVVVFFHFFGASIGASVAVRWNPFAVRVVVVWLWCALDEFDGDTGFISLHNTCDFSGKPDMDTTRFKILLPPSIKFAKLGEDNHRRKIASNAYVIRWIPHAVRWARAKSFEDDAGYIWGFIASSEEEGDHGHGNGVGELFRKPEHLEEDLDGDQCEEKLEPTDNLEHSVELSDLLLMAGEEFGREDIGPEDVVFAKGYLGLLVHCV